MVLAEAAGGGARMEAMFGLQDADFKRKMKGVDKILEGTGKSAKKTGDEGQKAMTRWGKSLDKAGSSAYDFGNQVFSSTTVMEAMKEGAVGNLEQGLFDIYKQLLNPEGGGGILAGLMAGGVTGAIIQGLREVDWGGVGHTIMTGLGFDKEFSNMTSEALMMVPIGDQVALAIRAGNWESAQQLLVQKISTGNFDAVDLAIKEAIGKGDYATANQLLMNQIGGADWSELSEPFFTGITSKMDILTTQITAAAGEVYRAMEGGLTGVAEGPGADAIMSMLQEADATSQEGIISAWETNRYISASQADTLRNYAAMLTTFEQLQQQLEDAGDRFAASIKDPSKYNGLGTMIYNIVQSEINSSNRG